MKKWMVILLIAVSPGIFAQELLMPDLPEIDSLEMQPEKEILDSPLFPGASFPKDIMQPLQTPNIDFDAVLSERWSLDLSDELFSPAVTTGLWPGINYPVLMPLGHSGSVFSSAAYKVNDRFSVGGYSFGANSVFTAPLPGKGINDYDLRGSTLFMKYNVSKNFKIETRVNVIQGPGPGF